MEEKGETRQRGVGVGGVCEREKVLERRGKRGIKEIAG